MTTDEAMGLIGLELDGMSEHHGLAAIQLVLIQLVEDEREKIAEYIETWHGAANPGGRRAHLAADIRACAHHRAELTPQPESGGEG